MFSNAVVYFRLHCAFLIQAVALVIVDYKSGHVLDSYSVNSLHAEFGEIYKLLCQLLTGNSVMK